jgi:hypothetical protein
MSLQVIEAQMKEAFSAIENSVKSHRAALSSLTSLGDVTHRFGFIEGVENCAVLFKNIYAAVESFIAAEKASSTPSPTPAPVAAALPSDSEPASA